MKKLFILLFLFVFLVSCGQPNEVFIPIANSKSNFKGTFDHKPITIKYEDFPISTEKLDMEVLEHAVKVWNDAVGEELFEIRQDLAWQRADIMVSVSDIGIQKPLDSTSVIYKETSILDYDKICTLEEEQSNLIHTCIGFIQLGQIVVRHSSAKGLVRELGAVLGFSYSYDNSLMNRFNTNENIEEYIVDNLKKYNVVF